MKIGPVKIEDRNQAEKGRIFLKDRWAVLCPSRLLLFKNNQALEMIHSQEALAVYPLGESQFELRSGELLSEKNFQNKRPFKD